MAIAITSIATIVVMTITTEIAAITIVATATIAVASARPDRR